MNGWSLEPKMDEKLARMTKVEQVWDNRNWQKSRIQKWKYNQVLYCEIVEINGWSLMSRLVIKLHLPITFNWKFQILSVLVFWIGGFSFYTKKLWNY